MKCAIFEEHSSSCVVYSRFSGTLFPVSMIDGDHTYISFRPYQTLNNDCSHIEDVHLPFCTYFMIFFSVK